MRKFAKAVASVALVHPEIFSSSRPSAALAFTSNPSNSVNRFASKSNFLTSPTFQSARRSFSSSSTSSMAAFYDLSGTKSDGTEISMGDFKGKVVYTTNVASHREFGAQEFPEDAGIQEFAAKQEFPGILMKLGKVNGPDASGIWKFMKSETGAPDPTWNFNGKFLISKDGKVSVPSDLESDIASLME